MRILRSLALLLTPFAWLSCQTGEVQPIVLDLSAAKTETPVAATATPPPAPTSTPAAKAAPPVPAATAPWPAPTPTPAAKAALAPTAEPKSPEISRKPAISTPAVSPETVAQRRVEAYNNRDLELLLSLYAAEARIYDPPDRVQQSGIEQIRQAYSRQFAAPDWSKVETSIRMTEGNFVVERMSESGPGGQPKSAIVVSEIREGRIVRVWIFH